MATTIPMTEATRNQIAGLMDSMLAKTQDREFTENERRAFMLLQQAHTLIVEIQVLRAVDAQRGKS